MTPEERREYNKNYYKKNKDKHRDRYQTHLKEYIQTDEGIKSNRISKWKHRGIICDDWDVLYERYLNTELCELCNVELTEDKKNTTTTRCLDHDHTTGEVRNIVCHSCNIKRG